MVRFNEDMTSFHLRLSRRTLLKMRKVSKDHESGVTGFIRDAIQEKLTRG